MFKLFGNNDKNKLFKYWHLILQNNVADISKIYWYNFIIYIVIKYDYK